MSISTNTCYCTNVIMIINIPRHGALALVLSYIQLAIDVYQFIATRVATYFMNFEQEFI